MKKNNCKGWLSALLAMALAVTLFASISAGSMESVRAATTLNNPRTSSDGVVTYDCVYFGNYWQEDTNGDGKADKQDAKQPIKWRVLSVDGNDAFLIADKNLDMQRYNTSSTSVTWETCTMRSWLNGYDSSRNSYGTDYSGNGASFIGNAFTAGEQNAILNTTLENADNSYYGTVGGNETTDKVFLLSEEDIANPAYGFFNYELKNGNGNPVGKIGDYSIYDYAKLRYNTGFAKGSDTASGATWTSEIGTEWWWLRSPGDYSDNAMLVFHFGVVAQDGYRVYFDNLAVCPALHLNLASSNLWSYAGTVNSNTVEENPTLGGEEEQTVKIQKLKISAVSKRLAAGKKVKLSVSITPKNASSKTLRWESSNSRYATVDAKGRVTLKKKGAGKTVTITAAAKDGSNKKAALKIKIMKHAVKSIKLEAKKTWVKAGKSITVKPTIKTTGKQANKTLNWTSGNTKYATVTKKGKVKTKKAGKGKTVKITASSTDGSNKKASIKIKIK